MSSPPNLAMDEAHVAAGALFGERRERRVVVSYGNAAGEYAAARSGSGLAELAVREILEASGPQRQKFLQGMLSHDVASRRPGQGCRAALMTAKGSVQALVRVLVEADVVVLETDFDRVAPLQ